MTSNLHYTPSAVDLTLVDKCRDTINKSRPLPAETLASLRKDFLLRLTYNSNAIEGNTLTLSETKVVIEDGLTIGGKSLKEHLEAINTSKATAKVDELAKSKRPLTLADIKDIHEIVLAGINDGMAGVYRAQDVIISGASKMPPSFRQVPQLMENLIYHQYSGEWQSLHSVVRAAFLHSMFVNIHPFIDGNGRTARLLMNYELLRAGYPPVVIKKEMRAEYYQALDKANSTGDATDWVILVRDGCLESEKQYMSLICPTPEKYTDGGER